MATKYFNAAVNYNWNTLGNWWNNSSFTSPATSLPGNNDTVYILQTVTTPPTAGVSLACIYVNSPNPGYSPCYNATFTSASGNASFLGSVNNGTINGNGTFSCYGSNNGIVTKNGTFSNYSSNFGTVKCCGTFSNYSNNNSVVCCFAAFNGHSCNTDRVCDSASFNSFSSNYGGSVYGNATLSFFSSNDSGGAIFGAACFIYNSINQTYSCVYNNAIFDGSTNYGCVTNNATFCNNSTNSGYVGGNATFCSGSINYNNVPGNVVRDATIVYPGSVPVGGIVQGSTTYYGWLTAATTTSTVTASIFIPGYMMDKTSNVYLIPFNGTTYPGTTAIRVLSAFKHNVQSSLTHSVTGYDYKHFSIVDKNHITVDVFGLSGQGLVDIAVSNAAGYTKLSNKGFLISVF
jgi:hypothetical protein